MTKKEFSSGLVRSARRFQRTVLSRTSLRVLSCAVVLAGLLAFTLASGQPVSAAGPWTVNTTGDTHAANPAVSPNDGGGNISLRSAIEAANAQGGTTTINVPPGTYTLSLGELQIGPSGNINVTINGTGNPSNTVIQQTNTGCPSVSTCNNRVFDLDHNLLGNVTVTIQHVTIAHGRTSDNIGGAGIIAGCEVPGCGGFDSTTVNDVVFSDNNVLGTSAGAVGGGIQNIGGTLIVQNSTFTNNSAGVFRGGGIYYDAHSPSIGTFTVSNSTFTGNVSNGDNSGGGAIYMTAVAGSTLSITGSSFSGNTAGGNSAGGAAVYKDGGSTLTIDHTTFLNNQVTSTSATTNLSSGGAIDANTGTVNVSFSRFVGNAVAVAGHGGGIYTAAGATTTATNNWWGCNGGANAAGCDTTGGTVSFNPWIVLSHTASPSTINATGGNPPNSTVLTASFLQNSNNQALSVSNVSVLLNLPVTWGNAQLGTLSGQQTTIQPNGTATATYTAGVTGGTGHADATVDNGTATASITINQPPSVTTQPTAQSVCDGSNVSFVAAASGVPAPTVQWQISTDSGATWNNIAGATSAALSFAASASLTGNQYRAVFTNVAGTATSNAATLTVSTAPVVTTNPTNQTVNDGQSATFTVAASGSPAPSVQWQVSTDGGATWADIPGATAATLSFTAVSADDGKQYRAVFTNVAGTATSNAATLSVKPITLTPTLLNGAKGVAYSKTITATNGTAPYSFAVTVGSLPPGLALSSAGVLSGIPTAIGSFSFTVKATDASARTGSQAYTIAITYNFTGFFPSLVNPPTLNVVGAGWLVPAIFSLGGNQGLNIFAADSPASQQINCSTFSPIGSVQPTNPPGSSGLVYGPFTKRYVYIWKTSTAWNGTCRQLIVTLNDGTTHIAYLRFK